VLINHGCSLRCSRNVFSIPKSIQATVILLENLHVILEKTPRDDIRAEVLPMLYNALESTTPQVQVRACGVLSVG
jgi:SCY1-like protein 2